MADDLVEIKQSFVEGLSGISQFWGFPRGMGAIFAVLYLSPGSLSLDDLVEQTHLTKGAISTNVRSLARLGLIHADPHLGDRKDYYLAETNFYRAVRSILKERQNNDFDRAIATVRETLEKLGESPGEPDPERVFLVERVQALKDFFDALDALAGAVARLDNLGMGTILGVLKILK